MTTTKTMLIAILALAVLPPALAAGDTPPAAASGFNGAWTLDAARSDDPAKLMPKPAEMGERPGGKGGGGMSGGPGMGGGGGGMGGGPGMGGGGGMGGGPGMSGGGQGNTRGGSFGGGQTGKTAGAGGPPELAGGRSRLVIFHQGPEFGVTDAMDISQTVTTDGRKSERWTHRGQVFETASVEDGRIVVRSTGQDGQVRTTSYELGADGNELTVLLTFKPPRADKDVVLRSVYVREKRK